MNWLLAGLALIVGAGPAASLVRRSAAAPAPVRRAAIGWSADHLYASLTVIGLLTVFLVGARVLTGHEASAIEWMPALPGGAWVMAIDPLSAVFVLATAVVGAAGAMFAVPYLSPERAHRSVWSSYLLFAVLIAAVILVVTAQAILPFLCAWEIMAIASYFLIIFESDRAEVRRAGLIYLVATHAGTLALFLMFALWARGAGDWTFAALAQAHPTPGATTAVLLLALFGFGVKAGLVPFHFWLPPAHAAAPSHVSALMSGIVIKTGIYGLLRVLALLGGAPAWWGWLVLAIGMCSGVLGVLWALAQHDLKRLLAYHSVENIGIILIGVGMGALGAAHGHPVVAALGVAGALLHTVNHALFKALLFLGAGVVYRVTGTREMERLGGLARRLSLTWLAFLVASIAIIGVPPLNGFVSEWIVYQSMFVAGQTGGTLRVAVVGVAGLALISALALACFAKVGGVVFLGRARHGASASTTADSGGMVVPMFVLAAACASIGLLPMLIVQPLLRATAVVTGTGAAELPAVARVLAGTRWLAVLGAAVIGSTVLLWLVRQLALRGRSVRTAETWACGFPEPTPRMQYTASSFAEPLLTVAGRAAGVRAHSGGGGFHTEPVDLVLDGVVLPLWRRVQAGAYRLRPIQHGRLHLYLLYVVAALLALLLYLAAGVRG